MIILNVYRPAAMLLLAPLLNLTFLQDAVAQNEPSTEITDIELETVGLLRKLGAGRDLQAAPPLLQPLRNESRPNGAHLWRLVGSYKYIFAEECELIEVPENFVTDLASIPAVARIMYNPADYAEAALVHDWLYAVGLEGQREKADRVFRAILIETGISEKRAKSLYDGVRVGGGNGYGLPDDYAFWSPYSDSIYFADEKPEVVFQDSIC